MSQKMTEEKIELVAPLHLCKARLQFADAGELQEINSEIATMLGNPPTRAALEKALMENLLAEAAAVEIIARRDKHKKEDAAQFAAEQRRAAVEAAQGAWRDTKTKSVEDCLLFWLDRFPTATFRIGAPCRVVNAQPYAEREHSPRLNRINIPRVMRWFVDNAACLLWLRPDTAGCTALRVDNYPPAELWPKMSKHYGFAPTLSWLSRNGPATIHLFKGKVTELLVVPGVEIIRGGFIPVPISHDSVIVEWIMRPDAFGKTLAGTDQTDLPVMPPAFLAALSEVGSTNAGLRERYFRMLMENSNA